MLSALRYCLIELNRILRAKNDIYRHTCREVHGYGESLSLKISQNSM